MMQELASADWNCSTIADSAIHYSHLQHAAGMHRHDRRQRHVDNYCSPEKKVAAAMRQQRHAKQLTALQPLHWSQMYGKEGATAMQLIQKMKPLTQTKTFKVLSH